MARADSQGIMVSMMRQLARSLMTDIEEMVMKSPAMRIAMVMSAILFTQKSVKEYLDFLKSLKILCNNSK